ncbi:uncharacterized protein [Physcomitrium patens]|uniref:Large ribosomal subunit protein uL18c n=1 Tax=Physcomitrium patens TaxID=3218 RepID=A0A2K1L7F0_PHYPA|nr:uncharacterized protein LOC112279250 [Physcomitrium patens]PNR61969.1 hypothetical protein PHYPA_000393 [Physcomitrium patens]|eukprot:XP_024369260.1 uncharacterized protein LOC112279250 [Physcomitrella patens]
MTSALMTGAAASMTLSLSLRGSPFTEFNGLAAAAPSIRSPMLPSSRPSFMREPLKIEALKDQTRRESVKSRHRRLRKKLSGTTERPRLAVFRTNQDLYAQVIDDTKQHTLATASTLTKEIREAIEDTAGPTIESAKKVGEAIGRLCLERGITKVAFDRGGFVYHGRIKALADAAREAGLNF